MVVRISVFVFIGRHSGQNKEETIDSKQEEKENLQNLNTEDKTIKKEDEEPIVDSPLGGIH